MKMIMRMLSQVCCVVAFLSFLPAAQAAEKDTKKMSHGDAAMHLHHMHSMMNHGLIMALQGSNLVMLSEMKMAPGVDEITLTHGKKMITEGKSMLQEMLSGKHM